MTDNSLPLNPHTVVQAGAVLSTANPLPVNVVPGLPASGVTAIAGNATGTTGAVVGTLTATSTTTAYISGFSVSAVGGVAAVGPITVAGLAGGSQVYSMNSLAAGNTLVVNFASSIPASAVNTNITVTTTADGTATSVAVNSWGFLK